MYRKLFLLFALVVLWILVQDGPALGGSLIGRWMCDEGQGSVVSDSSGNKRHGKFVNGDPAWTTGVVGSAVKLVGPTLVEVPSINMTLSEATMAGWVLPDGAQSDWASMFMHRGSGSAHGFNFLADRRLAYHWNDDAASWNYRGDAYYSATEWTHCALTVEPDRATFYVNGVSASVNEVHHNPANWNQVIHFGGDDPTSWAGRQMKGALDDLVFLNRALNEEQVAGLMQGTIPVWVKAENPTPADGATGVGTPMLSWTPGETATFVDVFVGTTPDLTAANRVKRQPASIKMIYVMAPPLEPGQTYYWRVDAVDAKGVLISTGDVWSFTMAPVTAFTPIPANGALYQSVDVDLAWTAGQNAFSHEVYFSTNQDDVANRADAAFQGSLVEAMLELPTLPLETTYYWAVDEIDALGDKQSGDVWSFTTTIPGLGAAKRELWLNGSTGTAVADLTNDARYPGNPTDVNEMPDFESPSNIADNYGGKLSAWLHVPLAGEYTFWVASDDASELWLGADADSAELIASVAGWTNAQEWDKEGGQKSDPIQLEAGRYFLMALWKDGTGGDNCAAAWQGAGIPVRTLITGNYLMPFEALWAYGPRPRNNDPNAPQILELKWTAGTRATTHQVYFSEDKDAVANGEPGSAAYRGQQAVDSTTFNPG
ncbi:MAG: hypothetical protein JW955_02025, partial [Sedimentisphaerales bacterium]|nr:hypothetical protein [Sedimentisphaerales bacterium]